MPDVRGHAYGWQVYPASWEGFGWHYSAHGPNGGTMGSAKTKTEAEERAQRAMRDLQRHTIARNQEGS